MLLLTHQCLISQTLYVLFPPIVLIEIHGYMEHSIYGNIMLGGTTPGGIVFSKIKMLVDVDGWSHGMVLKKCVVV